MPTVWKQDGFQFRVYTNDHNPSHVHIYKSGGEVLIYLGNSTTKPTVRENRGMSFQDIRRALQIAAEKQEYLEISWRKIHG